MLWSGRFSSAPDPELMRLTSSLDVDVRLLPYDLAATKAHASALARAGLVDDREAERIASACDELLAGYERGEIEPGPDDEDVHSFVERALTEACGELGARVHAGRSRNDLVATDLRLYCKHQCGRLLELVASLIEAICARAGEHADAVMPSYTHLQRAQPVSLGFHLLAHGFALARDGGRLTHALEFADVSALGAGAVAGTTLPLDPRAAARDLGFSDAFDNAMDAVSDRDFAWDLAYACACCSVHLSRLGEELVLWTSQEFGFARLPDRWSTGSSMMPQKRNPDLAELVRGRSAPAIAELVALLGLLKGLPLAYDRDLQEDKAPLFATVERTAGVLQAVTHLLLDVEFDVEVLQRAARTGASWATDLAESLVARGVPFREAHAATGALVADFERRGLRLADASELDLRAHHELFDEADASFADPVVGMQARNGHGATSPQRVAEQIEHLRAKAAGLRQIATSSARNSRTPGGL